jgi:predicted helicase
MRLAVSERRAQQLMSGGHGAINQDGPWGGSSGHASRDRVCGLDPVIYPTNDIFEDGPKGSLDHLLARLHGGIEKADNDTRGKQFEHICQWILEYVPEFADELEQVWSWADWPGCNGERDCGIDLVARHKDGSLWAVQATCYRGSIPRNELAKFIANSGRRAFGFKHKLLIATTDGLSPTARNELSAHGIHTHMLTALRAHEIEWPESPRALIPPDPEPMLPRDHQVDALEDVVAGLEAHGKGKLIMPCGTGKTATSLFIAEFLGAGRILVALPSLAL